MQAGPKQAGPGRAGPPVWPSISLSSFLEIHENKFENLTQVLEVLQTAFNWQQLLIILKL
jgi:hypothetical protein